MNTKLDLGQKRKSQICWFYFIFSRTAIRRVPLRLFEVMSWAERSLRADVSANPPINDHSAEQKPQIELSGRHSNWIHLTVHTSRPVAFVGSLSSCNRFSHPESLLVFPLCEFNWLKESLSPSGFLFFIFQNGAKPLSTNISFYCMSTGQIVTNICIRVSRWPVATSPHEVSIIKMFMTCQKGSCECEAVAYFIFTDGKSHSLWLFLCSSLIKILVRK